MRSNVRDWLIGMESVKKNVGLGTDVSIYKGVVKIKKNKRWA